MGSGDCLAAALQYAGLGWRVIPLHSLTSDGACTCQKWRNSIGAGPCDTPGKHPRFKGYKESATTDEAQIRGWWARWPRANVGLIAGAGSGIFALDVDPRNDGDRSLEILIHKHGRLPYTTTARTGGGGLHYYFRWPAGGLDIGSMVELDDGLEVIGEGHVLVAPPSRHPSGRGYEWEPELGPDEQLPVEAPAWLLEAVRAKAASTGKPDGAAGKFLPADIGAILSGCAWMAHCSEAAATLSEPAWYAQLSIVGRCKNGEELAHELSSPHPGYTREGTNAKLRHALTGGGPVRCARVRHSLGGEPFCSNCRHWGRIKSPIVLGVERETVPLPEDPPARSKGARSARKPPPGPAGDWRDKLLRSATGVPRPVLANVMLAFREAPEWAGVLMFDVFALRAIAARPTPWGFAGRLDDHQDALATEWINQQGISVPRTMVSEGLEAVAHEREVHPVRQYLTGLRWDRKPRLDEWLHVYVGAERNAYSGAVGAKWLIQAVARVMRPGCQADSVLIIEGQQGRGKSSAIKVLGGEWFTDDIADLGSKDAALQVAGVWVIELSELDAMARPELSKVKAFLTRRTDRFRPPYGRRLIENPRQCVFGGSVNQIAYLRDETGARRFWPVRCGLIDLAALAADRDQLWAEAFARFQDGETWWLDSADLIADAEEEQGERYQTDDPWEDVIGAWVENPEERCDRWGHPVAEFSSTRECVRLEDVLHHALGKPAATWVQADRNRVGRCLRKHGYEMVQRRVGERKDGRRERVFLRK